jgi:hypothetical protein
VGQAVFGAGAAAVPSRVRKPPMTMLKPSRSGGDGNDMERRGTDRQSYASDQSMDGSIASSRQYMNNIDRSNHPT